MTTNQAAPPAPELEARVAALELECLRLTAVAERAKADAAAWKARAITLQLRPGVEGSDHAPA